MKTIEDFAAGTKLVIWDGESDIKCPNGTFTASEIKNLWGIGRNVNVFLVMSADGSVVTDYGTDLGSPYASEDVVECGKLYVKDKATEQYKQQKDADQAAVCSLEAISDKLNVSDMRRIKPEIAKTR